MGNTALSVNSQDTVRECPVQEEAKPEEGGAFTGQDEGSP